MNKTKLTLDDLIDQKYKKKYGGITTSSTVFSQTKFAKMNDGVWLVYGNKFPGTLGAIRPNKQKKPGQSKIQFRPDLPDGYWIYIHYISPNHNLTWFEMQEIVTFLQVLNDEQPPINLDKKKLNAQILTPHDMYLSNKEEIDKFHKRLEKEGWENIKDDYHHCNHSFYRSKSGVEKSCIRFQAFKLIPKSDV